MTSTVRVPRWPLLALALLLTGCGDAIAPSEPGTRFQPPLLALRGMVLRPGEESALRIGLGDDEGYMLSDTIPLSDALVLEVGDSRVAAVVGGRRIRAVGAGATTLTVRRGARVDTDTLVVREHEAGDTLLALAVGFGHACAIDGSRRVRCWGDNWFGQIVPRHDTKGAGFAAARVVPAPEPAIAVGAGFSFSCMLGTSGAVHCWGEDRDRQTLAPGASGFGSYRHPAPLVKLAVGTDHGCALTAAGEAVCWGSNRSGQLGVAPGAARAPTRVPGVPALVAISAGTWYTCGLTAEGHLWCWGGNPSGAIDPGLPLSTGVTPRRVRATETFSAVDAGPLHTCAVRTDQRLACWGSNAGGELEWWASSPRASEPAADTTRWRSVSGGGGRTCGVGADDRAYCWGSNQLGALGRALEAGGPLADVLARPLGPVSLGPVTDVVAGTSDHVCAIGAGRVGYCWGGNSVGELGAGRVLTDAVNGWYFSALPVMVRLR